MEWFDNIVTAFPTIPFGPLLFGLVLVIYWGFSFFIVYHLVRFGIGPKPKFFALVFFLGSICLFLIAYRNFTILDLPAIFKNLKEHGLNWNIQLPDLPKVNY